MNKTNIHKGQKSKRPISNPSDKSDGISEAKNEPVKILIEYSSMAQCSAALGIPLETIKFASKSGCPAFRHHRVNTLALIRWLFSQDESEGGIDWGDKLNEYKAKREEIRLEKDRGNSADWGEVSFGINRATALLDNRLERLFFLELPPALKGLSEPEILTRLMEHKQKLWDDFKNSIEEIGKLTTTEEKK